LDQVFVFVSLAFFLSRTQTICEVGELFVEEEEVQTVGSGNNIRVKLKGIEETDVVWQQ
jgi:hypothetical protein